MPTKQQILVDLSERLSQKMPCFYHNISPLLAMHLSSTQYTSLGGTPFAIGEVDRIIMAASQSDIMYEQTINTLIDCVTKNIRQMIIRAYFGMQVKSCQANEKDWYIPLRKIIQNAHQAGYPVIVASYGVDLITLSSLNKSLRQQDGEWYLNNDRVYKLDLLQSSPRQDSAFYVLSKRDAPYFDFCAQYMLPFSIPEGGIKTSDTYHSIGLFERWETNGEELMVQPLIPILYHPEANIYALKVNINYDNI